MIDQEQTSTTNETENSGSETSQESTDTGSNTSTTETQEAKADERVDLGPDTEAKSDEDKIETDEEKAAREEHETLFGAPAEGEAYKLEEGTLPEGTVIDEEALAEIAPALRELGLSNKGASKIVGVYAEKVLPRVAQQVVQGVERDIAATRSQWEGDAKDAVAGKTELKNAAGEPLKFDTTDMAAVRGIAAKALDKLGAEGFREWLVETGLAVHPHMVAFAYGAGKLLAEDTEVETTETKDKKDATPSVRRKAGGMDPGHFYSR